MSTTFPIKDNTIRIDFINLSNELLIGRWCIWAIESFRDLLERITWTLINYNFCALLSFLLNGGEQVIIGPRLLECNNNSDSLLFIIIRFLIQSLNCMFLIVGVSIIWLLIVLTGIRLLLRIFELISIIWRFLRLFWWS